MDEFQVDYVCINEINLDLRKAEVSEELCKRLKKIDRHAKLVKTSSLSIYNES